MVMRNNGITKEDVIERVKQFGDLVYHVHHMGRTSVAALIIKESLDVVLPYIGDNIAYQHGLHQNQLN
jgi:GrpB-like predicted nucleotidyltransferase (UPF0157 family)